MKTRTTLAMAAALVTLAACSSKTNDNNSADLNAATDLNAGMTDMNATDIHATADLNATSNNDLNSGGGSMAGNATGNSTTNY